MLLSWLPYFAARPAAIEAPLSSRRAALPLLARPPADTIRPAVAIPFAVAALAATAFAWVLLQPPVIHQPAPDDQRALEPALAPLLPAAFPAPVQARASDIYRWAEEFGLPAKLVAVVMTLESCGDPSARSSAGAQGLFQVMPFHFTAGEDPLDPETNARRGLSYLARGLQLSGGDAALALAGYNGGHGLIPRAPRFWPAETVRYVHWGSGILADLDAGGPTSPTMQSWLAAGGERLCRQAASG